MDTSLYVVEWTADGETWNIVRDDLGNRRAVPAAYTTSAEARVHCSRMQATFPDHHYNVTEYAPC